MYVNQCYMISNKAELRSRFKSVRNSVTGSERKTKQDKINNNFYEFLNLLNITGGNIFIYKSFASEVETGEIIKNLSDIGYKILIPKCNVSDETMTATVYNPTKKQTVNEYGITEMKNSDYADDKIDLIIAPGICFDRFGSRIGFGKGYYDKFINSLAYKPIVVAICFSEQIFDGEIPRDEHDCIMDYIITDKEIIYTKEKK
ncbi:MAG: 5-formyltetrahydrofolate cyclo-ligase [Clostridia bacterium]|nr:5-formyltetrahydrofolate cyclo-ligase [Clostridia bacterium]